MMDSEEVNNYVSDQIQLQILVYLFYWRNEAYLDNHAQVAVGPTGVLDPHLL